MRIIYDKAMREVVERHVGPGLGLFNESLTKGEPRVFEFVTDTSGLHRKAVVRVVGIQTVLVSVMNMLNRKDFKTDEAVQYLVTERGWIPVQWHDGMTGATMNLVKESDDQGAPLATRKHGQTMAFHAKVREICESASSPMIVLSVPEAIEILDAIDEDAKDVPAVIKLREAVAEHSGGIEG